MSIFKTSPCPLLIAICFWAACQQRLHAQIVYAAAFDAPPSTGFYLYKINLATCEFCIVQQLNVPSGLLWSLTILPNGNIMGGGGPLFVFDPPGTAPISFALTPGNSPLGTALAPNGLVYVSGSPGFGVYDPATNLYTPIGNWPANIGVVNDLFFYNGQLYGVTGTNLILVDVNNPANSTIASAGTLPGPAVSAACYVPGFGAVMANNGVMDLYDMTTNTYTSLCFIPATISGLATPLSAVPEFACNCTTDAGTMQGSLLDACVNTTLTAVHDGNQVLDANDLLRFILYSNPANPTGSIIATSSTPTFTFAPPMQTGVNYYVAAIAGNNNGGSVDLADPCLDVSDSVVVVWRPLPTFGLSFASNNICQAGGCRDLTVTLTGTPPFSFTLSLNSGASTLSTIPVTTNQNTVVVPICPPVGFVGPLEVEIGCLSDFYCSY